MSNIFVYWSQALATILACLSAISDGIHTGWTSPIVPKLLQPDSPIMIDRSNANLLELIYLIGGIAGVPFTIWSVDKWGRKRTIIISAASNCLVWLLILLASNVYMLYVARFFAGYNGNIAFVSVPMYVSEMADKRIRGLLVTIIFVMMAIGCAICYSLAPFVSMNTTSIVGFTLSIIHLLAFPWMPESPYYHLMCNKPEEARKALQFFRRCTLESTEKELEELKIAVARQSQESGRFRDIFTISSNRQSMLIMTVLNFGQQLSCHTIIVLKLHTMFADNRVLSVNAIGIAFSLIMLAFVIVSGTIVDRFGRKVLLIFSSVSTALTLIALAGYMSMEIMHVDWLPIVAIFTFAAVNFVGVGSVPIVISGELFPTSVKAMAMTMCDTIYLVAGTIAVYMFQLLDEHFGMQMPLFLYALSCVAMAFFVHFYMPETKGKTLEQIQFMLKGISGNGNDLENMTPLQIVNKLENAISMKDETDKLVVEKCNNL